MPSTVQTFSYKCNKCRLDRHHPCPSNCVYSIRTCSTPCLHQVYQCGYCGKSFNSDKKDLKKHIKTVHTDKVALGFGNTNDYFEHKCGKCGHVRELSLLGCAELLHQQCHENNCTKCNAHCTSVALVSQFSVMIIET